MNFLNGQTYTWIISQPTGVYICVGFFYFNFESSAALFLIIRSVASTSALLCGIAEDVLLLALHLGKVKFCACHPPVDVFDVITGGLKVSCGII